MEQNREVSRAKETAAAAKQTFKQAKKYWKNLGPGFITGASDDDPSGIGTYSQAGAQYGFQLLWLSSFTFPLMATVQEMCARIGLVTGRGLAANIRKHYSRRVLYFVTTLLFAANAFNIGADLGAMSKVTQLVFPHLPFAPLVIGFVAISLVLQIFTSYRNYAKYLKWMALVLISYVFSALLMNLPWRDILWHTVAPSLTLSGEQILLLTAILGTTISPYLFFWQTSQEVEEEILEGKTTIKARMAVSPSAIRKMRVDVWSGMLFSNVVMFFIIAASAGTLYMNGITNIATAADAAAALRPLAGEGAYLLFALGIVGTGLLALPILAGSTSYAVAESLRWKEGLYRKWRQAIGFYGVIIVAMLAGLVMNFLGLDPIKALIYAAIANGLAAPIVLILIVQIASDTRIMGKNVNSPRTTAWGWITITLMALSGLAAIIVLIS